MPDVVVEPWLPGIEVDASVSASNNVILPLIESYKLDVTVRRKDSSQNTLTVKAKDGTVVSTIGPASLKRFAVVNGAWSVVGQYPVGGEAAPVDSCWKTPHARAKTTGDVFVNNPGAVHDGVTLAVGDTLLVDNASSGYWAFNGIWIYNGPAVPMTRRTDANTSAKLLGATISVNEGTLHKDTVWRITNDAAIVIGTTQILWQKLAPGLFSTSWKEPCEVATTVNGALATAFVPFQFVDGIGLQLGFRILIKSQTNPAENGIYVVNASGAPTRASDADTATKMLGAIVNIKQGNSNGNTQWQQTSDGFVLNSTGNTWIPLSGHSVENSDGSAIILAPRRIALNKASGLSVTNIGGTFSDALISQSAATALTVGYVNLSSGQRMGAGTKDFHSITSNYGTDPLPVFNTVPNSPHQDAGNIAITGNLESTKIIHGQRSATSLIWVGATGAPSLGDPYDAFGNIGNATVISGCCGAILPDILVPLLMPPALPPASGGPYGVVSTDQHALSPIRGGLYTTPTPGEGPQVVLTSTHYGAWLSIHGGFDASRLIVTGSYGVAYNGNLWYGATNAAIPSGSILNVQGGIVVGHTPGSGGGGGTGTVTSISGSGGDTGLTLTASPNPITTTGTLTLDGTLNIASGGTGQTTKTLAFDALSPATAKGDLITRDGANNVRFPVGANGLVLYADSTQGAGLRWGFAIPNGDKGDITVTADGATWTIDNGAVTYAKMQPVAANRLLGRNPAGPGPMEEISLGAGLALTGVVLNTVGFTGTLGGT